MDWKQYRGEAGGSGFARHSRPAGPCPPKACRCRMGVGALPPIGPCLLAVVVVVLLLPFSLLLPCSVSIFPVHVHVRRTCRGFRLPAFLAACAGPLLRLGLLLASCSGLPLPGCGPRARGLRPFVAFPLAAFHAAHLLCLYCLPFSVFKKQCCSSHSSYSSNSSLGSNSSNCSNSSLGSNQKAALQQPQQQQQQQQPWQ